ncbi:unnamed protein product [Pleuronectes platessa]|uniref:Uncharacterized protein n=1 Tax=Pleuronectes platessa TaxID=8262 RepID=A0A9N7TY06_PLEPL|nr:unnamed protein product [Pleuronectes platessa]
MFPVQLETFVRGSASKSALHTPTFYHEWSMQSTARTLNDAADQWVSIVSPDGGTASSDEEEVKLSDIDIEAFVPSDGGGNELLVTVTGSCCSGCVEQICTGHKSYKAQFSPPLLLLRFAARASQERLSAERAPKGLCMLLRVRCGRTDGRSGRTLFDL